MKHSGRHNKESNEHKPIVLNGKILSPGLAQGRTFVYRDVLTRFDEFYQIESSQVDEELERLNAALAATASDLNVLATRVKEEIDPALSAVFHAQKAIIQDPGLGNEIEQEVRDELISVGAAVKNVFSKWEQRFQVMESDVARQKGDDIRDLARRVISSLAGIQSHALEKLPPGSVLVSRRLLPSDTVYLSRRIASAALLEMGGAGSHAALFAREIGLPCISALHGILDTIPHDVPALVDAREGSAIINPHKKHIATFTGKIKRNEVEALRAKERAHGEAVTRDRTTIQVLGNVGTPEDTLQALDNGAEGIGLFRIEHAFLGHQAPPKPAAVLKQIQETLEPARHLPVCVRLLDIGADKPLEFMESFREPNPALGRRGIRFLKFWPELLQTQLEALLELASQFDLHILVPMITVVEDFEYAKQQMEQAAQRTGAQVLPRLGAMIETPGAALCAGEIAQRADFLSFGTNDLTQYLFAADRENASVDDYFDDTHEAVFRMLRIAAEQAGNTPLSVCGELAARPDAVERLLQIGITSLSVAPPAIPWVKDAVRASSVRAK
ncbi:MAG: phosphoenolpyruvate--protein phosphotransferase [Chitinivibrionales bacterium]|nr:phosphoenolpyruvate--protein phosphotransferase [Chitinivibrionales bacterium]